MNLSNSKINYIMPFMFIGTMLVLLSYVWSISIMTDLTVQKTRFYLLMSVLMLLIFILIWFRHSLAVLILAFSIPCFEFSRHFINTQESIFVPENIIIIFMFFAILDSKKMSAPIVQSQLSVLQLIYVFLVFISLLSVSGDRRWSLFYIGYLLPLIYFFLLKEWLRAQPTKLMYLIPLGVAAASWPMFYFTITHGMMFGSLSEAVAFNRGGISNWLVGLIVLFFPLLLALKKWTSNRWLRLIINISLALFAVCFQISLNRGALLMVPILFIILVMYGYISFRQTIILVILVVIGNFVFDYVELIGKRQLLLDIMENPRWDMIKVYLAMIKDSPLTGIGLGNFYASPHSLILKQFNSPCHNLFTYIAAETGIPSLMALLSMVVIFCRQSIKCIKYSKDAKIISLSRAMLIGMISYLVFGHITGVVLVEENMTRAAATGMYMFVSMLLLQENLYSNHVVRQSRQ